MKTRDLVFIAVYAALFVVLEVMDNVFGLFKMPQGGSLSLSVLAIIFASYHLGFKRALITTVIAFLVRFIVLTPKDVVHPVQFVLDYILAPGSYALAVLVPDLKISKLKFPIGVLISGVLQFAFHAISGFAFYAEYHTLNMFWGILSYTATYVVPTVIAAFIITFLIKDTIIKQVAKI